LRVQNFYLSKTVCPRNSEKLFQSGRISLVEDSWRLTRLLA
jgi:hypothetical protein